MTHELKSRPIRVADTIGAGDSFTATLICGLLRGLPLEQVHQHAMDVASYVCTQYGAMPELPENLKFSSR